jgi:Flp pilus assembly protein TadG
MRRTLSKTFFAQADENGSVIVELALMLPLLAVFFLGATDLGLIIREHQVLQNAAREGARFSAQPANRIDSATPSGTQVATAQSIRDRVINYLSQEGITLASTACTESPANQWNCGAITIQQRFPIQTVVNGITFTDYGSSVSVTYNRSFLFSGGSLFQFNSVSLNGNSVFHNLYGN